MSDKDRVFDEMADGIDNKVKKDAIYDGKNGNPADYKSFVNINE